MAAIELDQLSKQFPGGIQAVRDLCLSVADGELLVLVGPSGCGKTTTLRLLAGLEQPSSGIIRIGGKVVNQLAPHQRDIAMVFQRPALYPHLNVRDNLAFGLRLRSQASNSKELVAERVTEAAQLLGLHDLLERRPAELSGGQQQRVALGRAIVRRPALFLLDEPLSGLDAPLRTEMRRELHLLHRRLGATMIYVTHDQVEAVALGDRVALLDGGVLQQVDRPQALYDRPANRFVAGFIGGPSMNFLDGCLAVRESQLSFQTKAGWLPVPPRQADLLASGVARDLTLGIRPEHVQIADCREQAAIRMEVVMAEPQAGRWLVTLRRDDWQLTALVDTLSETAKGQSVAVRLNMEQAHWFDRATGKALAHASTSG